MDPILGTALVKGGTALAKYLWGRMNQPEFGETSYAKRLKERMNIGKYGPAQRREIIGDVAKTAGNIAQGAKAGYRGRLASQGMLGSVAGMGKQAEIDAQAITPVSDTARKINVANVESKEQAKDEYAMAETSWAERVRQQKGENRQQLVGGVVDAAAGYVTGKLGEKSATGVDFSDPAKMFEYAMGQPDPAKAISLMRDTGYASKYLENGKMNEQQIMEIMMKDPSKKAEIMKMLDMFGWLPDSFYEN